MTIGAAEEEEPGESAGSARRHFSQSAASQPTGKSEKASIKVEELSYFPVSCGGLAHCGYTRSSSARKRQPVVFPHVTPGAHNVFLHSTRAPGPQCLLAYRGRSRRLAAAPLSPYLFVPVMMSILCGAVWAVGDGRVRGRMCGLVNMCGRTCTPWPFARCVRRCDVVRMVPTYGSRWWTCELCRFVWA